MTDSPASYLNSRLEAVATELKALEKKLLWISWGRLGLLLLGIAAVLAVWELGWGMRIGALVLGMIPFVAVIAWHQNVRNKRDFSRAREEYLQAELKRNELNTGGMDGGEEFLKVEHPYAGDMDLFGPNSLFQWISRSKTRQGRSTLANWLLAPSAVEEIRLRQKAVEDLSGLKNWRESFHASGLLFEEAGSGTEALEQWLAEKDEVLNRKWAWMLPFLLTPLMLAAIVAYAIGYLSWLQVLPFLGLNLLLIRATSAAVKKAWLELSGTAKLMNSYASLLQEIETCEGKSDWVKAQQDKLKSGGKTSSLTIKELSMIFERLDLRRNAVGYMIVNSIFFWDIYWMVRLEKWRRTHRDYVVSWFEVIGQMEAISSLAGSSFLRPNWTFPSIMADGLIYRAESAGHPLIPEEGRVANPIHFDKRGEVHLITGSNMSGKSTYLRTVGVNAVLALSGAPVCAVKMEISPLRLASSMRTQDSLSENVSAFYAELKRLRLVLDWSEEKVNVFFLLDEILKGTNSADRHNGARRLIRQLNGLGATGLVSTHDLELTDLEQEMKGTLRNFSFNSFLTEKNKLEFDYTLTPGPCRSFNASILMQQLGIGAEPEEKAGA